MNSEELNDFESFYGWTEEESKKADKLFEKNQRESKYSSWHPHRLKDYYLQKFLYPMLKNNEYGTVILSECIKAGHNISQHEVYRFKKNYKEKVELITNRAIELRKKVLSNMRRREMFYPDHYDYMTDIRTINREMHALMPFKEYLFDTLKQMETTNE
jgi:hypothetical protein